MKKAARVHITNDQLGQSLAAMPPITLSDRTRLKFELKPYLQPFEQKLALAELRAVLGNDVLIEEHLGFWAATTRVREESLRKRLTYWQRLGRATLVPTDQTLLELTQNGIHELTSAEPRLHRARRLRYGPHGLHEYRGKFFPQLVRSLITIAGASPSATVLDPMCGSGTAPCEALSVGHPVLGADLNPLSVLISRVKCSIVASPPNGNIIDHSLKVVENFKFEAVDPKTVWPADDLSYLGRWFAPEAISDIASILASIKSVRRPDVRELLLVCLSNIIRSVSWQKETDLRVRKEVSPYTPGEAISRFSAGVSEQIERISPYLRVLGGRGLGPLHEIREGDAVSVDALFSEHRGKIDLIVTSPPYATALPYLDTDRLSLVVLGLLSRREHALRERSMIGTREITEAVREQEWLRYLEREKELPAAVKTLVHEIAVAYHSGGDNVGFRRRNLPALLGKYFLNMLDAMRSARMMVRRRGDAFYVVGNNSTTIDGERVTIPTDEFLIDVGVAAGWNVVDSIPMELLPSRDIFRENRGSRETILWFRA